MKYLSWIAVIAMAAIVPTASAQVDVEAGPVRVQVGDRAPGKTIAVYRANEIIGMDVQNSKEESLGTIDNLVLDSNGQVHFAIIARGGLLGVGTKYHAVPWQTLAVREDSDDNQFVFLNMSPELFEKGPSFASDEWPDFRSDTVCNEIKGFYKDVHGTEQLPQDSRPAGDVPKEDNE